MKLRMFAVALAAGVAIAPAAFAQPSSAKPMSFPIVQGKTFKFERIADGVYYATGGFGSNNTVIINDRDVMLVDTGTTPANARRALEDTARMDVLSRDLAITDKSLMRVFDSVKSAGLVPADAVYDRARFVDESYLNESRKP